MRDHTPVRICDCCGRVFAFDGKKRLCYFCDPKYALPRWLKYVVAELIVCFVLYPIMTVMFWPWRAK